VDLVFDELLRMAAQCETTELTRFPELRDRVVEVVNHMLRKCVGPTQVRGIGGREEGRGVGEEVQNASGVRTNRSTF